MFTKPTILQTEDINLNRVQSNFVRALNPVFNNALLDGGLLKNVSLISGQNAVNHLLGRNLTGWFLVRKRGSSDVWDTQDVNATPHLTLLLNAASAVEVDIYVF